MACVHDGQGDPGRTQRRVGRATWPTDERPGPTWSCPRAACPAAAAFTAATTTTCRSRRPKWPGSTCATGRIVGRGPLAQRRHSRQPDLLPRQRSSRRGPTTVDAYYQLDALKQRIAKTLAAKPDDPQALAALGEVKLDEGALAEAVELFRRSYALGPDETTRVQLIESLLEGLRVDFAAYRATSGRIGRLVEQPRAAARVFCGSRPTACRRPAKCCPRFETYHETGRREAPLGTRRDRRASERACATAGFAQQLAQLRAVGRSGRGQRNRRRRERSAASGAGRRLGRLRCDVRRASSDAARRRRRADGLVDTLDGRRPAGTRLAARTTDPGEPTPRPRRAAARLAAGAACRRADGLAAVYYRQLAAALQRSCAGGQTRPPTGRRASLPTTRPAKPGWPTIPGRRARAVREEKDVDARPRNSAARSARTSNCRSTRGPLFPDINVAHRPAKRRYWSPTDGLGGRGFAWRSPSTAARSAGRLAYNAPSINYVSVNGGLLVLSLGNQLMAIDTLRGGDSSANRVLWIEDLNDQIGGLPPSSRSRRAR